ncbi:hypothetical protein OIU93_18345 [Paeniglutamicibacter sp. ZC-3]|uniref:hypothetical protein n=1 Tax=Paeniglutamicibacter sp. ZC-3 TaxID=2986919 RepID=UPI0021F7677C|nr:hypothetical protein [Paeniglutamicibacter sp. ZC-3]MCV9996236.1 hypothetical protein [Paeniglutamicibacter sp. ZC-3]
MVLSKELRAVVLTASFHFFPNVRAGNSPQLADLSEAGDAVLRAQWAHESIGNKAEGLVHYENAAFSISPRSESGANEIVEKVFGPLRDAGSTGSTLVKTLCAYLDADRKWFERPLTRALNL